uniref:Uncharacterized protein n=1 Tax=Panagrolaimus sp. JU765 TaxID=591449 RepID=A0AC34RQI4_9BILA
MDSEISKIVQNSKNQRKRKKSQILDEKNFFYEKTKIVEKIYQEFCEKIGIKIEENGCTGAGSSGKVMIMEAVDNGEAQIFNVQDGKEKFVDNDEAKTSGFENNDEPGTSKVQSNREGLTAKSMDNDEAKISKYDRIEAAQTSNFDDLKNSQAKNLAKSLEQNSDWISKFSGRQFDGLRIIKLSLGDSINFFDSNSLKLFQNDSENDIVVNCDGQDYLIPRKCEFIAGAVEKTTKELDFLNKQYSTILLDPPWPNKSVKRTKNYNLMFELDDLFDLPIENLLSKNGILIIWLTNNPTVHNF